MPEEINAVETVENGTSIGKMFLGGLVLAGACVIAFGFGVPYMLKNRKEKEYTTVEDAAATVETSNAQTEENN